MKSRLRLRTNRVLAIALLACMGLLYYTVTFPGFERTTNITRGWWTDEQILESLKGNLHNLPSSYWTDDEPRRKTKCGRYPSAYDLRFDSLYWQVADTSKATFYLYGAYYDTRLVPTVRMTAMTKVIRTNVTTYCQVWYDNVTEPVVSRVYDYSLTFQKEFLGSADMLHPYLLSCRVPYGAVPSSVSLVEHRCDKAWNNLRVVYDHPDVRKDFAVCVKDMDFLHEDPSVRLIEWIELMHLLGADTVYTYILNVHPNVEKVLQYYADKGIVHVSPTSLPGGQPNLPWFQHLFLKHRKEYKRKDEVVSYNDCLYRNMYRYRYLVLLDTDEVIMPVRRSNWSALMQDMTKKGQYASYGARNTYFFDDKYTQSEGIPDYMHMLRHVTRSRKFNEYYAMKSFYDPRLILTLNNHYPLSCLSKCSRYEVSTNDAYVHHYRRTCHEYLVNECEQEYRNDTVVDTIIWRYKDQLIARTQDTLSKLFV